MLAQLARAAEDRRRLRRMLQVDRQNEDGARTAHRRNQKRLRQAEAAADRMLEAIASGVLRTTERTIRKYREIAGRVSGLTVEAERLRASLVHPRGLERVAQVQEALRRLPEQLQRATPSQRRAIIGSVISRVWIDDDGIVSVRLNGTDVSR